MGKDEADRARPGKVEFPHDRHEVVAVRAKAVQPDDAGGGVPAAFDFRRLQQIIHGFSPGGSPTSGGTP
ncbi:hypothetical protein D3C83_31250 [compost metagenome]